MLQQRTSDRRLWRDEIRATLALAWPLVLTNLAQGLIGATDTLLLGWAGAGTLAAAALGINLYMIFLIFGLGLMVAASPMVAKEIGARAHSVRDVRRTLRQTMWLAAAFCVPAWLLLWHAEPILIALRQDPALAAGAQRLLRTLQWGMLPALLFVILRSFVSALERPLWSFIVVAAGVLLNALLNYGLILGNFGLPAMGLTGAGIGSSLANGAMFLAMVAVVTLHRRFRRYRLFGYFWHADWPRFRQVWRLGLPIAVTMALEASVFNITVFMMGLIGATSIAAHVVIIQIATLTFMVALGLGQAATVRVGLAFGRKDEDGIARAGWTALVIGIGFMSLMAILMLAFPRQLIGLFLDPADPASRLVIPLATSFLFVAALFQVFDGVQAVGAGVLRGLHDTKVPMFFAGFGYWAVGLLSGVGLGFGLGWQGLGLWIGLALGIAVVAALMLGRWVGRDRIGLTSD
ncbi:MAG TPA: MATE family efflux transporter [Allosphingosinicella sp.]|nr:MATE family efflux transporter [Allosphingosinicella sp.]